MNLRHYLLCTVTTCAFLGLTQDSQPRTSPSENDLMVSHMYWESALSIVKLIDSLPPWRDGPMAPDDVVQYINAAEDLQSRPSEAMSHALVTYMVMGVSAGRSCDYFTKPMIVLRVMFNTPNQQLTDKDADRYSRMCVLVCGGFRYRPLADSFVRSISAPVKWDGNTFVVDSGCVGLSEPHGIGVYQPQLEYEYFRTHFKPRSLSP